MDMGSSELPHLIPWGWEEAVTAVARFPGIAMIIGAPDSGKTSWVTWAAQQLSRSGGTPMAIVDADIGQTTIGPPATVSLSVLREPPPGEFSFDAFPYDALSCVGSVSPIGHLLQTLVSCKRLVDRANQSGAETVLVDTTGLVSPGIGFQLKLRKIELLNPSHLVVLQQKAELESLLAVVEGRKELSIHRLQVSPLRKRRTPAERSEYRSRRFAAYFAGADPLTMSADDVLILAPPTKRKGNLGEDSADLVTAKDLRGDEWVGLLVGLNNAANETLGLGLLESVSHDGTEIHIVTPMKESALIRILQLGSIRVSPDGSELN